ncbi:MAG: SGNH/GDSL hydrolase family protein [Sphingomonas sp.]
MGIIATAIDYMIAAGITGDALVSAVADMEAAVDTRSPAARRQARYRARRANRNAASQSVTRDVGDAGDAPPNDIYSNPPSPLSSNEDRSPFVEKQICGERQPAGDACRLAGYRRQTETERGFAVRPSRAVKLPRALTLAALCAALLPFAAQAAPGQSWVRTWEASPMEVSMPRPAPAPLPATQTEPASPVIPLTSDVTFRMVSRISAGGTAIRLRLSNELSADPLRLGAVHVALAGDDGAIVAGSDQVVTFEGSTAPVIPAGAPLLSDRVALKVPPLAHVVVSIYVPGNTEHLTGHQLGVATTHISPGDQTGAPDFTGATTTVRYILSGIDVSGGPATSTIVTLGDSITDGALSSKDTDHRWPDILAERLRAAGKTSFAVANAGISGNRLLATGAGPAALARFDRDVLSVPGVRYVVVLEGINDIGATAHGKGNMPLPKDIIGAYRQLIARAHDRGVKVIGATITPYKGAGYYSEDGDAVRQAVNDWIRAPGHFDGVIDFARTVADKADPLTMAADFDSGDKLHPGDAGYKAMAEAVDLALFR